MGSALNCHLTSVVMLAAVGRSTQNVLVVPGTIMAAVTLLLAMQSFLEIRKGTSNAKCLAGFGSVVLGWFAVAVGFAVFQPDSPIRTAILGLMMLAAVAGNITGLVLAIIGLVECSRTPEAGGKTRGILGLVLSGTMFLGAVGSVVLLAPQNRSSGQGYAAAPDAVKTFNDLNFKYAQPGGAWIQGDPKKLDNSSITFIMTRRFPDLGFEIVGEKFGVDTDVTLERVVQNSKSNIVNRSSKAEFVSEQPVRRHRIDGVQWGAKVHLLNADYFYCNWVICTNGYAYQLLCWGPVREMKTIEAQSEDLFARFSLLDPARVAETPGVADLESTNFAYRIRIQRSAWRAWENLSVAMPGAELGAVRGQSALAVIPVSLMGTDPHSEMLSQALLSLLDIDHSNEQLIETKRLTRTGGEGVEYRFERARDGVDYTYKLQVLRRTNGMAYLVMARAQKQDAAAEERMDDALGRVEFVPTTEAVDLTRLSPKQLRLQGLAINQLGLCYFRAKQYQRSVEYFKKAYDLTGTNTVFLINVVNGLTLAGNSQEALDYLESHATLRLDEPEVLSSLANLQAQCGREEDAIANYARLFARGHNSDDQFNEYVRLLGRRQSAEAILGEVEAYLKHKDSVAIRVTQANLYRQARNFTNAVAILKTQHERAPFDLNVTYALIDAFHDAGLFSEELDLCDRVVQKESDRAADYFFKGRSEFALKRYREAKASFEKARSKAPASTEIKNYLDLISGMLGEGSNADVKNPIPPVPLPPGLPTVESPLPAGYGKDHGAFYSRRVTAMAFRKKKDLRTTDYLSVKILDASGISKFSTLQFGFDPIAEEIFVNTLEVRDAEGRLAASGKVDDYYVVDDRSTQVVTHKKVLNIPIPGLQPGYQFDLTVTTREVSPPEQFPFSVTDFSKYVPVRQSVLAISGDVSELQTESFPELTPVKFADGLFWTFENPPVYRWEPFQASVASYPAVWLGASGRTWASEGAEYAAKIKDRLEISPETRALAAGLTRDAASPQAKIAALARYVQTNCTYKAIEFGRRARVPQSVPEILRNKYGDCKDHALLLSQLLESVGVPAKLALVNARLPLRTGLPSLDQFNHMIVYLPGATDQPFIDCTQKDFDVLGGSPIGLSGKEALIVGTNASLVTIPDCSSGSASVRVERDVEFTNKTDLLIREKLIIEGYSAGAIRMVIKAYAASSRRDYFVAQIGNPMAEIQDARCENLEDSSAPLKLSLVYVVKRQFQPVENRLAGRIPAAWEHHAMEADPVENRRTPFQLMLPVSMQSTTRVRQPKDYKIQSAQPASADQETKFGKWRWTSSNKGDALETVLSLDIHPGTYPAADYAAYQKMLEKAQAAVDQNVILRR